MLNSTILLKVKQRLNKLDSTDYDNIQTWQIVEAFNKGQVDWCRRNLHGLNILKEGDEQSNRRIDDLQVLLASVKLNLNYHKEYYESDLLPTDYLQWKKLTSYATRECCPEPRRMVLYLAEVGNVDILLKDFNKKPSFEWAESFLTIHGNKIQIYTNGEFDVVNTSLTYYKQPRHIQIANVKDPYTGLVPIVDIESEFKDDLVELFIDECVKILAGDIESMNQVQRATQAIENNN